MWWAVFLRTGLPPRQAKRLLTAREAAELRAYYQRIPFDDENAHHAPAAQLAALYANAHRKEGTEPFPVADFLQFRPRYEPATDLDAQIVAFFKGK